MNPAEFQNIALAEERMWWFRGMRAILRAWARQFEAKPLNRVLEAGCGTGYMSEWMAREFGWRMTPLDLEFSGLSHTRLERRTQGDICALPYRDGCFDAVVSLDVIVHLERGAEGAALREFARVLAPRGMLVLRTSALDLLRSRHSQFAHERQRFTRDRLRAALEAAGFTVDRVSYANSLLLPVAFFKFRVWEPLTRQAPASGVVMPPEWLNSLLEVPLRLEARWLGTGLNLPLGQSLLVLARKNA
jgi:SAM-dependent methyltransferase